MALGLMALLVLPAVIWGVQRYLNAQTPLEQLANALKSGQLRQVREIYFSSCYGQANWQNEAQQMVEAYLKEQLERYLNGQVDLRSLERSFFDLNHSGIYIQPDFQHDFSQTLEQQKRRMEAWQAGQTYEVTGNRLAAIAAYAQAASGHRSMADPNSVPREPEHPEAESRAQEGLERYAQTQETAIKNLLEKADYQTAQPLITQSLLAIDRLQQQTVLPELLETCQHLRQNLSVLEKQIVDPTRAGAKSPYRQSVSSYLERMEQAKNYTAASALLQMAQEEARRSLRLSKTQWATLGISPVEDLKALSAESKRLDLLRAQEKQKDWRAFFQQEPERFWRLYFSGRDPLKKPEHDSREWPSAEELIRQLEQTQYNLYSWMQHLSGASERYDSLMHGRGEEADPKATVAEPSGAFGQGFLWRIEPGSRRQSLWLEGLPLGMDELHLEVQIADRELENLPSGQHLQLLLRGDRGRLGLWNLTTGTQRLLCPVAEANQVLFELQLVDAEGLPVALPKEGFRLRLRGYFALREKEASLSWIQRHLLRQEIEKIARRPRPLDLSKAKLSSWVTTPKWEEVPEADPLPKAKSPTRFFSQKAEQIVFDAEHSAYHWRIPGSRQIDMRVSDLQLEGGWPSSLRIVLQLEGDGISLWKKTLTAPEDLKQVFMERLTFPWRVERLSLRAYWLDQQGRRLPMQGLESAWQLELAE